MRGLLYMEIPAFRLLREGEIEWAEVTAPHWRLVEIPHSECYWEGLVSECSMNDTAYRTVLWLMTDNWVSTGDHCELWPSVDLEKSKDLWAVNTHSVFDIAQKEYSCLCQQHGQG